MHLSTPFVRSRRQRYMAQGLCVDCGKPKEEERTTYTRCGRCARKNRRPACYKRPALVTRDLTVQSRPRAKWIYCKRCKELGKKTKFWSDDYRRITRCDQCQRWMAHTEDALACEGARYDAIAQDEGFEVVRDKLTCKTGKMTSAKQKVIRANTMLKDQVGVKCRSWTRQEIDAIFTPAYCADLLARAQRNTQGMYTELMQL